MDFISGHLKAKHGYKLTQVLYDELLGAIINQEVMPSMRALMTAGKALSRDNTAGYNCSYLPIDDLKSFDEAMYILLCFAPETLVQTVAGNKRIDAITLDDQVLSFNEETKEFSFIAPSAVFKTATAAKPKVELTFEDGSVVKVTDNHLFLTHQRGWVQAKDLTEDDDIVDNQGQFAK
jgi:hypothetical protein